MRIKNIGFWLVLFSIITLIFSPAIIYPFFQDDFFALVTTKITSFGEVSRLFLPAAEAVYWRPLGIQLYFGVMQFLGLGQPIWFHLVSLGLHLLNTYLVYRLVLLSEAGVSHWLSRWQKFARSPSPARPDPRSGLGVASDGSSLTRKFANFDSNLGANLIGEKNKVAKLTAFLWGISPIHYFALGWVVNFSFILVVTWSILAILASREGNIFRAILFLILGLMTNEMAVVIPLLVILLNGGKRLAAPMLSVVAGYVVWRILSGVKIEGDYAVGLTAAASTLRWYGLWMLGWSDIVRDFIRWGAVFTPEFVKTFPAAVTVYLVEVAVILGIVIPRQARDKLSRNDGLLWAIIGLMPVLFFQKHLYSHYAAIAAIGLYWWLAEIVVRRGWEMLIVVVWIMVAFTTMGLNYRVSWMADHAVNSAKFQSMVLKQVPSERVSRIYIVSESSKAQTVLLGGYGVEYLTGIDRYKISFIGSEKNILGWTDDVMVIKL